MKILQIGKFYPIRGGVEKVMYDITVGLSQRQVHCDMLCASAEQQRPKSLSLNKYARILCVPTWKKVAATMLAPAIIYRYIKLALPQNTQSQMYQSLEKQLLVAFA